MTASDLEDGEILSSANDAPLPSSNGTSGSVSSHERDDTASVSRRPSEEAPRSREESKRRSPSRRRSSRERRRSRERHRSRDRRRSSRSHRSRSSHRRRRHRHRSSSRRDKKRSRRRESPPSHRHRHQEEEKSLEQQPPSPEPEPMAVDEPLLLQSEQDEEALIAERRRRREAILSKYQSSSSSAMSSQTSLDASAAIGPTEQENGDAVEIRRPTSSTSENNLISQASPILNGTKLSPLQPDTGDVDNVVDSLMTNMKDHVAVDHNTISHTAKNGDADLSARSTPAASKREGSRTPEEFDISAMPSEADLVRVGQTAADSEDDEEAVGKEANEDDQKHNEAILEKVIRHPAQQPRPPTADMFSAFEDMFAPADDMFSATHITEHANPPALATTVAPLRHAIETTDDPEGYYQIIIGEVLDERYQVFTNLGRGVFSCVVRARDIKDPGTPDVAIKIIRNNDVMYKAGQKEYSILKRLQEADPEGKKHVVRMLSNFEHRKHLCIVFESMSMNLREVLKKFGGNRGLNIRAVRVYAQQLFMSLSLLRKCNVLHADIKPDNMLVNEAKNVLKLADMGSASDAQENDITPYLVSRFYRAPEIILGLPYDFALDMWSVGCTLYELYTGKVLFPGRSNNQMLHYMMELKGRFPLRMLKRGRFTSQHFDIADAGGDTAVQFCESYYDKLLGRESIRRRVVSPKAERDLRSRLLNDAERRRIKASSNPEEELAMVSAFVDLLEKVLTLNPERRLTVREALTHPFISGQYTV